RESACALFGTATALRSSALARRRALRQRCARNCIDCGVVVATGDSRLSNPIALFRDLRDTYFRYLDSPYDIRYPDLIAERRRLLDADGRLYRHPLIEPVPA